MNAGNPNLRQIYNDGYYLSKLLSFYGRINYSLKDKYLLTATMRADGSTKFGKTTSGATSLRALSVGKCTTSRGSNNRAG